MEPSLFSGLLQNFRSSSGEEDGCSSSGYRLLQADAAATGGDGGAGGCCAEDVAGEEIVDLYYGEEGDPTGGVASQNPGLHNDSFVDHSVVEAGFSVGGVDVQLRQTPGDLRLAGVTGCVVWNGAVVLGAAMAHWSAERTLPLAGLRILELGSGSGMLACVLGALVGEGGLVVSTEQEERLALLRQNISANASGAISTAGGDDGEYNFTGGGIVRVRELDWFDIPGDGEGDDGGGGLLNEGEELDVILAADVIYNEPVTLQFVKALAHLCRHHTIAAAAAEGGRHDVDQGESWYEEPPPLRRRSLPAIVCLELRTQEIQSVFVEAVLSAGGRMWRLPLSAQSEEARTRRVVTYLVDFSTKTARSSHS